MEENSEQENADEETDFELSEMEEDDIDLLEPSQNADTDAFVENDNGTDDLDEDEIIAEEMRLSQTTQLPNKWRDTK